MQYVKVSFSAVLLIILCGCLTGRRFGANKYGADGIPSDLETVMVSVFSNKTAYLDVGAVVEEEIKRALQKSCDLDVVATDGDLAVEGRVDSISFFERGGRNVCSLCCTVCLRDQKRATVLWPGRIYGTEVGFVGSLASQEIRRDALRMAIADMADRLSSAIDTSRFDL